MKKISFNKKVLFGLVGTFLMSLLIFPAVQASESRDCDSNAVLYCGAYSTTELINKIKKGTGKTHQSGSELTKLYTTVGMSPSYFDDKNMKSGYVYKNGNVTVNGKVVYKGAKSMGRHKTTHSTKVPGFSYPLYWRPTSDSFASEKIPAYVYINYDGSMAFAIIKSCGNPVKGHGVKTPPVPKYSLTVKKWNDIDGDQVKDSNENYLGGWSFNVKGPNNYSKTVTTASNGSVSISGLVGGTYTVDEIQQNGWEGTTTLHRSVTLNKNTEVWFGNRKIAEPKYSIVAKKFEDVNGNSKKDSNESWIAGWSINIKGNGVDKTYSTKADGSVTFTDLPKGTYTVTEAKVSGWKNITPISQTITLPTSDSTKCGYAEFGNQREKTTPLDIYSIKARKFEDINGNGTRESNEPWIKNWHIILKGNNVTKDLYTDEEGTVIFSNLKEGSYTVSEEMQEGWKNTTPISKTVKLPNGESLEGYAEFGNQKKVTPTGEVEEEPTPVESKGGPLPTSGPAEAATGVFGGVSLLSAGLYYRKGKAALLAALKK